MKNNLIEIVNMYTVMESCQAAGLQARYPMNNPMLSHEQSLR